MLYSISLHQSQQNDNDDFADPLLPFFPDLFLSLSNSEQNTFINAIICFFELVAEVDDFAE